MEKQAETYLSNARSCLQQHKFEEATSWIEQMRKECSLAITAREQGIVLLDSIHLMEAKHDAELIKEHS